MATLIEILERRKQIKKDTLIVFLDLKKAYDLVPHKRLLAKIEAIGYGPKLTRYIKSMYEESRCVVKV